MTFPQENPNTSRPPFDFITVVSGLPRSGTSMMMKMLEAGGVPVLTDKIRRPDEDNPKGYYEYERVKKLKTDQDWLPDAVGKVVKIVSFLLLLAPPGFKYKVVFMRRALPEVLASQQKMLERRGEVVKDDDDEMAVLYTKHLRQVYGWLEAQPHMDVLYVDHRKAIENPRAAAEQVNTFLGGELEVERMVEVVDKSLHRQRT
jgi:hypothetical protein